MQFLFSSLLTQVLVYKYIAIFCITFLGALALPLPANTIVTASSFFALQGYLSLPWVFLAGYLGNVTGDVLGYFLARQYGIPIFKKLHLTRFLFSTTVTGLERKIQQHPFSTVFFSRFVSAVTPLVNIFAGIARLPFRIFILAELVGLFLDVGMACIIGVVFGDNWQYIQDLLGNVFGAILLAGSLIILLWLGRRSHRRSKKTASPR